MKKYILRRVLKRRESLEIEAEDWDAAVAQFKEFMKTKIPDDCTIDTDRSCIQYTSEVS